LPPQERRHSDAETKETLRFDAEKKTVQVANRANGER